MWKITRFYVDIIRAQREIKSLRRALFRAADLVESPNFSCQIDRFIANGLTLTNQQGYDKFISTVEVTRILRERAEIVRAMAWEPEL